MKFLYLAMLMTHSSTPGLTKLLLLLYIITTVYNDSLLGENKGLDESKRPSVEQQQQLNKTEAMPAAHISSSYPL